MEVSEHSPPSHFANKPRILLNDAINKLLKLPTEEILSYRHARKIKAYNKEKVKWKTFERSRMKSERSPII